MRSPRALYLEKVRHLCAADPADRYATVACRVRVYERGPDGNARPKRWLPDYFGGVYDRLSGRYTDVDPPADQIVEVPIHEGQLKFFELIDTPGITRVMGIGAQGGGKSEALVKVGQCLAAWRPGSLAGVVAPARDRLEILWDKFLATLDPIGWVEDVRLSKLEIVLKNRTMIKFRGAKRQSNKLGSPIAGRGWHWALEDEQSFIDDASLREVDARGRISKNYRVFSSATNDAIHEFQVRVREYETNPRKAVVRFSGWDNCFTPLEHWEKLKANWSKADYDRFIDCKDVPAEGRVYPEFSYKDTLIPATVATAAKLRDITPELTANRYRTPFRWIVGFDPGVIVTASVILKVYAGQGVGERRWHIVDEVTTRDKTSDWHAEQLKRWFREHGVPIGDVVVLMDPSYNKETDRSDLLMMRAAGFECHRSNGGEKIERRHRISMVNALLCDATGNRRLFLETGANGTPIAAKTAESFGTQKYKPNGELEKYHGTVYDVTHWTDAVGYAVFPWERVRGGASAVPDLKPVQGPPAWRTVRGA